MKPTVTMVTRKLEPGAMELGTAMPLMLAELRAVKRERAVARKGWGRMVGGGKRLLREWEGLMRFRRGFGDE